MKLTKSQRETVGNSFLLKDLALEDRDRILDSLEAESYRGGEPIYTPSEFKRALGIVAEGEVSVMKPGGAQLNVIPKGGCFGAAALFDDSETDFAYVTTLIAHKACQVVFISDEQLEAWIVRYPVMALGYIRFLSGRVRFLNRRIDSFTSPSSEEALIKYLKEKAGEDGQLQVTGGYARMARSLSMSRATLYRALSRLESDGLIRKDGNLIVIVSR